MTTENFYYWLKGYFALRYSPILTAQELLEIKAKLDSVVVEKQEESSISLLPSEEPRYCSSIPKDATPTGRPPMNIPVSSFFWDSLGLRDARPIGFDPSHAEFVPRTC